MGGSFNGVQLLNHDAAETKSPGAFSLGAVNSLNSCNPTQLVGGLLQTHSRKGKEYFGC